MANLYWFNNHHDLIKDIVLRPKIVGYFSVDGGRNYLPDSSSLMYLKLPTTENVCLDLNEGIESTVLKPTAKNGSISHLLKWIKLNHTHIQVPGSGSWIEPKFACSCGLLATVMCTPYRPRVGWIICATKWKGTIYMCRFPTPEEIKHDNEVDKKFTSWGCKFEQCVLSDSPHKDPDTSKPVIQGTEFRCVFQRTFGNHSVLFTADRDGLNSTEVLSDPLPLDKLRFVELKTVRQPEEPKQITNFKRFKLPIWWAKSFLAGNEKILVGIRDGCGIVHTLKNYSLLEIMQMSKEYWDPVRCIYDVRIFLNHVANTVTDDCNGAIYRFEKIPYGDVITRRLSPQSEYAFIPDWYFEATKFETIPDVVTTRVSPQFKYSFMPDWKPRSNSKTC